MHTGFIVAYFSLLMVVSFYGIHLYWLIVLYYKYRNCMPSPPDIKLGQETLPYVTVQLPLYNEKRVAVRLIEAVCNFDWPIDKLQIQVLDDSTDETSELIENWLANRTGSGPDIVHLRRKNRNGFKAGALAAGLSHAQGEFVAIFDADNIPGADFLKKTIPHFADKNIAMVQTRWSFLNRNESFLCRAQALFLDAHFIIEQQARFYGGLLFNFNGTAGVWRCKSIADAGGWQHDTLTEDLDLSMRAQLAGWKFVYLKDYTVPTELPNSIAAFKSQQYRWVKGAAQTGFKLLPEIFRSNLPLRTKLGAFFHFSSKVLNLAILLLAMLLVPALYFRLESGSTKLFLVDLPIFLAGTGSMSLFYSLAYRASESRRRLRDLLVLPMLTSLGIGLAVNNSRGLLSALFNRRSGFIRTPKSGSTDLIHQKVPGKYAVKADQTLWLETALAIYSLAALTIAFRMQLLPTLPFLAAFFFGYLYFSFKGLKEAYE